MVHTMIENSALRPQLYQQVRSWTVNDTAFSSAKSLSDSFGFSSDLPITSVFSFFSLLFMFIWESTLHPCFSRCCSIVSMALLNILPSFWSFRAEYLIDMYLEVCSTFVKFLLQFHIFLLILKGITADFYGNGFVKLFSLLGHLSHASVLGIHCVCMKVITSNF